MRRYLWQRVRDQGIAEVFVVLITPTGGDDDELFPGLPAFESHRRGETTRWQLCDPQFLAGVFVKGTKSPIIGCANEHQTASGDHRATNVRCTRRWDSARN